MSLLQQKAKTFERTAPYLKQSQIEEMSSEKDRLASTLRAPPHLRNAIQDASTMMATLKRIERSLERDTPREYTGSDLDAAVKREAELKAMWLEGMPTQEEMRRNPPGALDKHMQWEARHKQTIAEWKNIRRRLMASGAVESSASDRSVANIELHRPKGGAGELAMDNAQIPRAVTYSGLGGRSVPFTDIELAILEQLAPKLKEKLILLSADQRDDVKTALADSVASSEVMLENVDTASHRDLRDRCRAAGLETGGAREDLVARLKQHYRGA
jgi:hypothetical protein